MFGKNNDNDRPSNPEAEQAATPPKLPLKTFRVTRYNRAGKNSEETFDVRAHFLSNLDHGGVAFNIYDFETPPQGITTVRVINDYFDIEQVMVPASIAVVH